MKQRNLLSQAQNNPAETESAGECASTVYAANGMALRWMITQNSTDYITGGESAAVLSLTLSLSLWF